MVSWHSRARERERARHVGGVQAEVFDRASGDKYTHLTLPLISPSRYGTSVAASMESSSIIPEDPED